jgi:hypothetical protein
MPILRDHDLIKYNRDEHEIRHLQYGRGLSYNQIQHGDGIKDYFKNLSSKISNSIGAKIGETVGAKVGKKVGETVGEKVLSNIGSAAKFGVTHAKDIKNSIDLVGTVAKHGISIGKEVEDLKRSQRATEAQDKFNDEFFRQLRLKSDEIKKGQGMKKKSK